MKKSIRNHKKKKEILTNFEEYFNDNLKNKLDEITEKSYEIESEIDFYQESFNNFLENYCSEYDTSILDIDTNESDKRKLEEINDILNQLREKITELDKISFKLIF